MNRGDVSTIIPKIVKIIAARPATKMTLEMITRDPLKVPCLKYAREQLAL